MASHLSGYCISCLQETFTLPWNVADRQSETHDTQMKQTRIYCLHRSLHLLLVSLVRIHTAELGTNSGYCSSRLNCERRFMDTLVRSGVGNPVQNVSSIHCPGT
jgi:hypothetical protein